MVGRDIDDTPAADPLQLAIRLANGTKVHPEAGSTGPRLLALHAQGSDTAADATFWFDAVPGTGLLEITCWWPARDIPETTTVLDGAEISAAAARAVHLGDGAGW